MALSITARMTSLIASILHGGGTRALAEALKLLQGAAFEPIAVTASIIINAASYDQYNGQILVPSGALSITIAPDLFNFSCLIRPPVSGTISIVSSGGVLLEGAITTLTRTLAGSPGGVAIYPIAIDSYGVTGG